MCDCSQGLRGKEKLGSSLTTLGTTHLHISLKQREVQECVKGEWTTNRELAGWASLFFLLSVAWQRLSGFPTICKDLSASPGLMGRAAGRRAGSKESFITVGEMCYTQQGRLSSLLLLRPEPQILKRCRTCTSQITIHHRCSGSPGVAPPDVRLTGCAFSPGPSAAGNTGTSQAPHSCSGQSPSTTIY